jgi:hypothetical protein
MLSIDLFATQFEKKLHEGALDDTITRTQAHLMEPLSQRAADIRTLIRNGKLSGAELTKLEKEYEDLVQKRLDIMREAGLPDVSDKAAKMARLNQPGKAGTDAVSPQQRVNPNPNKGVIGHAADWLRGKGGPGKEGPTYEEEELDEAFGPVGSKGLMNGNLAAFMKARQSRQPITLDIGAEQFRLTPAMMDAMANKYNEDKAAADSDPTNKDVKLIAINNYRAFGYPDLMKKFIDAVATPETTPPAGEPGEQLPMFEKSQRLQKKKSNNEPEITGSNVRDTKLSRALTKARGAYPTAGSDIEALVRQELDAGERVKQDVGAVQNTNTAQDQTLSQLEKVNQQQTAQIAGLEKQLSTAVQQLQTPVRAQPAPDTTKPVDTPIATNIPEPTTPRDQEIYDKVQSLEKELKNKIDAMASWNAIAQQDPQSNNELVDLRKEVARTRKELQTQINKLTKANKGPTMVKPKPNALPDPNVVDVDAWEIPDMGTAQDLRPIAAREGADKSTAIGQMAKNVGQGQELQRDPAYRSQVRRTQQQVAQRQQNIAQQQRGYGNDADEFVDIPDINEGAMKELDIMRQDVERMNDRQFYTAYGISKAAFQQKYRTLLKPALDEHGGGIGPKQHWQDLMQERKLSVGDPVVVTAPNEFEGKTGEIHELSPSGKFVIVNLYNHGKHSMHLSDVEYNQYADDQEQDDWYDEGLAESNVNPQFINSQVTKLLARATQTGNFDPLPQLLGPLMKQYNLTLQQIDTMVPGGLKKAAGEYGVAMKEGFQDFNRVEPYAVCLAGKPVKKFDYYEDARRFHDNWKKKLYREGDKAKADKITLMPLNLDEFDASGYDRYSIYMDDYDLKEKFADLDDAIEAIEEYKRDDPKSQYADYNVRDLNGKVVWRNDAWQDIQKPGKIQFIPPKTGTSEAQQWQGNRGADQAHDTDHDMDEARKYIKGNYSFAKKYRVRRAEPGFRANQDSSQFNRSNAHVNDVDSAMAYLQLKQNPAMSGSAQPTPSLGYSWHTNENPGTGIAVLYYEDRGMGWDEIVVAAKDKKNLASAVQVFRDAGVIPQPKATKVAETNDPSGQIAIHNQGLEMPIASKYAGNGQFKITVKNKPAIVTVAGFEIDNLNPGLLDSFYLTDVATGKTHHVTGGWNDPVAVAIFNNLQNNQKPALKEIYKQDMAFYDKHEWDGSQPDRLQGLSKDGYTAIPADSFVKSHQDMKKVTGQDLSENAVDSKSWMAEIKAKYPTVKFMQAKMPGAPIRAYVDNKVVAEFNFGQPKMQGTAKGHANQQQWMQSIKQQYPNVKFPQNKTTMQIFAMVPGKGQVGTFDPRQQVTELEVADLVKPGAQTDTPPRRAYSIALQGRPGKDFMAEYAWKALNSVFPKEYPVGTDAAEQKVAEVTNRGSAIVKTGIASEDIADTYVAKLAAKRVPAQFWRIVGGELEETTAFLARAPRLSYGDQAQHTTLGPVQVEKTMPDGSVVVYCERDGKRYRTSTSALKPAMAEGVSNNLHADLADVYRRLAPGIERHRDSFKAGQLYDALEAVAEQHGAETEFKRMMNGARNRAHMDYDTNPGGFHNWFWYLPFEDQDVSESDQQLLEGIKDTASATAVIACLLTGGSLTGCATAPQQTSAQQVLKTGQDIGRTVQTAKKITHAGIQQEVQQEIMNLARATGGDPGAANTSNILRIWRMIKGRSTVQAEPEVPEYGPAEPKKRMPQYESKEIVSKEDFIRERDRLLRMIGIEPDLANKQILKSAIRQLENRAENEGWITIQSRMMREDSDNGEAVEMAIIRRMLVAHTDLIVQFGLDKVVQAIEEVAYNVGEVDEIGSSDVSAYVNQVKQILGVPEEVNEKWSKKYKSSINCANPKGFSQKAHCAGRKK